MQLKKGVTAEPDKYRKSLEKRIEAKQYPERYAFTNYQNLLEELEKALQDEESSKEDTIG